MSAAQRSAAAKLRQKYARHFGIPIESVETEWLSNDDAVVCAPPLPEWTTGVLTKPWPPR